MLNRMTLSDGEHALVAGEGHVRSDTHTTLSCPENHPTVFPEHTTGAMAITATNTAVNDAPTTATTVMRLRSAEEKNQERGQLAVSRSARKLLRRRLADLAGRLE
ncbi:hypothetical protein FAM22021_000678 [Propionibacterium freudenreichii]|nr:hypothetical protein [Propionibacterium freudenreichii]